MIYECIKPFEVDRYEDEERDYDPIGVLTIEKGSLWERRRNSSDYEVMLDNIESGEWLGMGFDTLKSAFALTAWEEVKT
jgi:hypothetical protein